MTERVIEYVTKQPCPLYLYVDTTLNRFKIHWLNTQIYIYSVVIAGSFKYTPLDVTTYISSKHGIKDITIFFR